MMRRTAILAFGVATVLAFAFRPVAGQVCDDGLACTQPDMCVDGVCEGTPIVCADDGNACTVDECVEEQGGCVHTPIVCDDLNPCTADSCDPARGCVFSVREEGAECHDIFQCTTNDRCRTAIPFIMLCDVPGVPVNPCVRPFGNACVNHQCVCTSDTDCRTLLNPDLKRKCIGGRCVRTCTGPGDCPLSQLGEAQVCMEGKCWVQLPSPVCLGDLPTEDGAPCNDQLKCTDNDRCQIREVQVEGVPKTIPAPVCLGDPRTGPCNDELPCTEEDTCQNFPVEIPGLPTPVQLPICLGTPVENGTACQPLVDDGIPCTSGHCLGETIEVEGVPVAASVCVELPDCPQDEDLCTLEACYPEMGINQCRSFPVCGGPCVTGCDPGTGECITVPDGTSCDDGDACTVEDRCKEGECAGVAPGEVPTATATPTVTTGPPTATVTPSSTEQATATRTATISATATATRTVTVEPLTATVTPSSTEQATATRTATISVTATATTGRTPTEACPGDCDGGRTVTVDELVKGVRIALGEADLGTCSPFDKNSDGKVTIDELIMGVRAALEGCSAVMGT